MINSVLEINSETSRNKNRNINTNSACGVIWGDGQIDIREGFVVEKILELKFEELVKVKPADGGDGQVRSGGKHEGDRE